MVGTPHGHLYRVAIRSPKLMVEAESGSPNWARTSDPLINSQLLYQLSYRGTNLKLYTTIKK